MASNVRFVNYILLLFIHLRGYADGTTFISVNNSIVYGKKLYTVFERKPYVAFWKIPYAEAPVGQLRFKVNITLIILIKLRRLHI